jgi:hypothetical protein
VNARAAVRRSLLWYGPLFGAVVAVWIAILLQPVTGGDWNVVGIVLVTPVLALVGWQFANVVRDLRADLVTFEGEIRKKWSRFDLPLGRSYYVHAGTAVFRLPSQVWAELLPGDRVSIVYLPHTATVESMDLLPSSSNAPVG